MTVYYYGDINSFSDNINLFFTPIIVYHYSNIDLPLHQWQSFIAAVSIFYFTNNDLSLRLYKVIINPIQICYCVIIILSQITSSHTIWKFSGIIQRISNKSLYDRNYINPDIHPIQCGFTNKIYFHGITIEPHKAHQRP